MTGQTLVFRYGHLSSNSGQIKEKRRVYEIVYPLSPRGNHLRHANDTTNVKIHFDENNILREEKNQQQTVEEFVAEVRRNNNNQRTQGYYVQTTVTIETTTEKRLVDEDQGSPRTHLKCHPY